jgi:anaerobic selenocysteine-containing dehydrogenase
MPRVVKSVCSHDCPDACGVLVTIDAEDGVEVARRFAGDPDHPFTRGFLCGKVQHYEDVVYHPGRILTPLRRSGPKGSGRFSPLSWDAAITEIARRIGDARATQGGESILQYYYAGTMGTVHRFSGDAVFHHLGATRQRPNICYYGADEGYRVTVGLGYGVDPEDAVESDLIVVWGCNVVSTQVHLVPFFEEARKRGARILVIDPYRNRSARIADEWIRVEPGTDTALALGILHVIDREGLVDRDFVARRTIGYERLASEVLPRYAPERTSAITGVGEATIVELARDIAAARSPLFKVGIGLGRSSHGASAMRAICCLAGGVGAWKNTGGGVLYDSGCAFRFDLSPLTRPDWLRRPTRFVPQTELGPALTSLDDPPIRVLWVHGANPAATCPLQDVVRRGLAREDLFTVVHERFLTDTALWADIVLPAPTFAETSDLFKSYGHLYLRYAPRAIPPRGECRPNLEVFQMLARALGIDDPWTERSVEDFIREILTATKHPHFRTVDLDELFSGRAIRLDVPRRTSSFDERFATPSGKLEFYSAELEPLGHGLVEWRGDPFATDLDRFPLRLLTPPAHEYLNSSFGILEKARTREGRLPLLFVHPEDAAQSGVGNGDEVELSNEHGAIRIIARVTEDTAPGTVVAEGTWWPLHSPGGRGINVLTSNRLTDLGGGSTFHDNRVALRRAPAASPTS